MPRIVILKNQDAARKEAKTNTAQKGTGPGRNTGRSSRQDSRPAARQNDRAPRIDRGRLLEYAQRLLEPLASLEMLCEADEEMENVIFFMNRAALETMSLHHRQLNPLLKGVDVRNALGRSIHQFHKDPERIRNVFRALTADP